LRRTAFFRTAGKAGRRQNQGFFRNAYLRLTGQSGQPFLITRVDSRRIIYAFNIVGAGILEFVA
jgi:hypothetical protein